MGMQNVSYIPQLRELGIKGHTLIQVVVAGALSMILMAGVSSLLEIMATQQRRSTVLDKTQQLVASLTSMIEDETAWKNTVDKDTNTNLNCLKNPVDFPSISEAGNCTMTSGGPFNLYDRNDQLLVEALNNTSGFAPTGPDCNAFSPSGNSMCPLHVNLTWEPLCTNCFDNQFRINIEIIFAPSLDSKIPGFIRKFSLIKNLGGVTPVASHVVVGKWHTCAVAERAVYCWGRNDYKQLGAAATGSFSKFPVKVTGLESGVTDISAGYNHTCAIKSGNVYCWGTNSQGRSGAPDGGIIAIPNLVLDNSGVALTGVTQISGGMVHTCAITGAGAAYCWGANGGGSIGYYEPAGLERGDEWLSSWGPDGSAFPVLDLSGGINGANLGAVTSIAAGVHHSCAVVNGGVRCWGSNDQRGGSSDPFVQGTRALGNGSNVDRTLPADGTYKICYPYNTESDAPTYAHPFRFQRCNPRPVQTVEPILNAGVKKVFISGITTCALTDAGDVWCWGGNWGKLGQGYIPNASSNIPLIIPGFGGVEDIGGVMQGFCALRAGKLWCWGMNNAANALGRPGGWWQPPGYSSIATPIEVTGVPGNITFYQGGAKDESYHNCAVANRKVYCWGENNYGQLGNGSTRDKIKGVPAVVKRWRK